MIDLSFSDNREDYRISRSFFIREDVVMVAEELLGKYLVSFIDGQLAAGMITETEAYRGLDDKACHAFNNKRTQRTEVMFWEGGHAYVYLIYGLHHLFNVVTGTAGMANAVRVRAIEPVFNIELMLERRKKTTATPQLTAGPGVLSQALGIKKHMSGINMLSHDSPVWLEDRGVKISPGAIRRGPRVGIDYAEECVNWPWRFRIKNSKWTSK